jgi:hypothetical protein
MRQANLVCLAAALTCLLEAQQVKLSDRDAEAFLRTAKVVQTKSLGVGITNSQRLTLSTPELTHDAHLQTIDEYKTSFQTALGTEINFRDSWKYNVAGYKIDRLLGLNMTPVSVERKIAGKTGSVTWWVDDVLMMEVDRHKKKIEPPDQEAWNCQMFIVRIFDQLIYNTDRNLQNLLITKDWSLWMIDHTRAFRLYSEIKEPKNLTKCDRKLMAKLRELDLPALKEAVKGYLTEPEMKGILARRDRIVRLFEEKAAAGGEAAVFYDAATRH